jgi:2-methylisocitrate lyase-like PEP mutase family enzyme
MSVTDTIDTLNALPDEPTINPAAVLRRTFRELHREGTFVIPNPWDIGSGAILEQLGFVALATTSSGFAASLGRMDQRTTRDELIAHVTSLCGALGLPINVDAERCFAADPADIAAFVADVAAAGAAGLSIEDYDAETDSLDAVDNAVARVAAAAEEAKKHGMVLTGRAENHLHGVDDIADTIARLRAYKDAGADCLYAPGLTDLATIERLVREVNAPVNVLAMRRGPSVRELTDVGVRRVSTGGSLTWAAYGALHAAATELLTDGTSTYLDAALSHAARAAAFTR